MHTGTHETSMVGRRNDLCNSWETKENRNTRAMGKHRGKIHEGEMRYTGGGGDQTQVRHMR